jgi:hypothetical protein
LDSHEKLIAEPRGPAASGVGEVVPVVAYGVTPALDVAPRPALDGGAELLRRVKFTQNPDVLLTSILDECHFLMREVATTSALRANTVETRLAFVHTALACARAGAKVGKTIAAMQSVQLSEDRKDAIYNDAHALADRLKAEKSESCKQ